MFSLHLDPISLSVVAGAILLLGLADLLLARRRVRHPWRRPLVLAGVFAILGGLCWACSLPIVVAQAAILAALVAAILALARSPALAAVRWGAAQASRPAVQAAVVMLVGGVLLGSQVYRLDTDLAEEFRQADAELEHMGDPIAPDAPPTLMTYTDAGQPIPLFTVSPSVTEVDSGIEERFLKNTRLEWKLIKTGPADLRCNCHGWVFTSGRYWVRGANVPTILEDNKYQPVTEPRPGDLVVFRNQDGDVIHTGVVRTVGNDQPVLMESKWGKLARYIHTADDHAYRGQQFGYYRSPRGAHTLKGQDTPNARVPVATMPNGS